MLRMIRRWAMPPTRALLVLAGALVLASPCPVWGQAATPRQSSPIAVTEDALYVVAVNPEANSISVFDVYSSDTPIKLAEITVGNDPNSVALHPVWPVAYVTNALDGTISVVDLSTYAVTNTIGTGAEPMAVATSPNGTMVYVANASSNTLTVIDANTLEVVTTIDLSAYGTSPRAVAVTNDYDTDDTNETIFVAMFFGQLRAGKTALHEGQDDQREGRIVAISAATNTPAKDPIRLGPIANAGFNANGRLAGGAGGETPVTPTNPQTFTTQTGAFPNQLASMSIIPYYNWAYVPSTGASPNGPFRFNVNNQGLLSVFNTATYTEITAGQTDESARRTAPLNMNQGVNLDTALTPKLFFTNPVAIAWRPDASDAWVVVQNTDVVLRVTVDENGIPSVGAPLSAGAGSIVRVDLQNVTAGLIVGKAPRGIAINSTGNRAYVFNYVTRSVTVIDITDGTAPAIVGTARSSALPTVGTQAARLHLGQELFLTGRGPQGRMSSEGWGGCIVCHPNGRADGITWMFPAGPRQTIPLDGMFNHQNPAEQRILNWSALRDENHDFELNTRNVFGGRGLINDDRLFLAIGGALGTTPTDSALLEQFHQATGAITTTNDLRNGAALPTLASLTARRDFAIATLSDDRVLIIGGRSGSSWGALVPASDAVLEFNPRTNVLRRRSSAGFLIRHSLGAAAVRTSLGTRIYAIGGYSSTSPTASPSTLVQEYNPATNSWRTVAALLTPVAQFGITAAGGINTAEPRQLIHVVSGNTGSESAPSVTNPDPIQRYQADPSGTGAWTTFTPAGLTLRRNHGAATGVRGASSRIFIIGGQNAAGTVLSTVDEYVAQAVTLQSTTHTSMPAPRARFGISSSLSTNQIYVIGGVDGSAVDQTTIFEYTTVANGPTAGPPGVPSGTWATRGNLSAARRGLQVSMPPGITNFNTARSSGRDPMQDAIAMWVARSVRASTAPVDALDPAAVRGRQLFGQVGLTVPGMSCASCHGGQKWTRSKVDFPSPPSPEIGIGLGNERIIGVELRQTASQPSVLFNLGTFTAAGRQNEVRFNLADISNVIPALGANGFNIPSLLSVHETAPYFYNGLAQTLEEVLDGSQDGVTGGTRVHFVLDSKRREDLIMFLKSIDERSPIFK